MLLFACIGSAVLVRFYRDSPCCSKIDMKSASGVPIKSRKVEGASASRCDYVMTMTSSASVDENVGEWLSTTNAKI